MEYKRFGIYFTPPEGAFADAGAVWLGWDIASGQPRAAPDPSIIGRPRRYGFHATIKPPCRLRSGETLDAVAAALQRLCASEDAVRLDGLSLSPHGRFLSLLSQGETARLDRLAARVVRDLDDFRAPPTAVEQERRRKPGMDAEELQNIEDWGYPHVMSRFRFHMTLTGPLSQDRLTAARQRAEAHFQTVLPSPLVIDALALVGEGQDDMFRQIARFPLRPDN